MLEKIDRLERQPLFKTMYIPQTITIKSDGNKLQFLEEKKGVYKYRYVVSKSKLGMVLELDEIQLNKLIKVNT